MPERQQCPGYDELQGMAITPVGVDMQPQELEDRRRLLGPEADISHPEFGRQNRPEETFRTEHQVEIIRGEHGGTAIRAINRIYDHTGRLIDENINTSPLTQFGGDLY